MDYTSHDCIFLDIPERSEIWNRGDNVLHVIDNKYSCNYRSYGEKVNLVLKKQICIEYFLQIYISFRSYKIHNKTKSSPGVTGAASERPLEGVADGSTGSPTFILFQVWRNRSEGDSSPSHTQKKTAAFYCYGL